MVIEDDTNDAILRGLFEAVDLDTSVFINENELAAVCDLDPNDLKEIFEQIDINRDGKISVEDFVENYKKFQVAAKDKKKSKVAKSVPTSNGVDTRNLTPSKKKEEKERSSAAIRKTAEFYLGQEYLDDLYEIARSRNDPMLLESLESFLAATVEGLLQKQSDNDKLDTALKRATEKNSAIALELEAEMEHQVAMLEEKIREEEQRKLEEQKHEAQSQLFAAQSELKDMEGKVKELEDQIEQKKDEANIPETIIEEIQNKEKENKLLQNKLVEFQTQMALMRTEVAQMKAVYDEQAERLANERGAVLSCVSEQENLTRQLHLLHEANKRLHDTNDDLRSALDHKRSTDNSYIGEGEYPFARSASVVLPKGQHFNSSLYNSFRSDPGGRRLTNGNLSHYDTDDDSKLSIPYDEEDVQKLPHSVNETPLLAELIAVDKNYAYDSPIPMVMGSSAGHSAGHSRHSSSSPANSTLMEAPVSNLDRENFIKQLEILCETNKRLGESNDELRDALGLLSGQIRMDQEIIRRSSNSDSTSGVRSAPITPLRNKAPDIERPQSTSSPRRILLTKSGYHSSLYETQSMPDISVGHVDGTENRKPTLDDKICAYIANNVEKMTTAAFDEVADGDDDVSEKDAVTSEEKHTCSHSSHSQSLIESRSCSPSSIHLSHLSSLTTGPISHTSQSSNNKDNSHRERSNGTTPHPPSNTTPPQSRSPPGTGKVPPDPNGSVREFICRHRKPSLDEDSRNRHDRTCDCGNEIYGSDISICDYCLDSITSAVDELTTDYASSFTDDEDDQPTIYTDKETDSNLYNVTGEGIYPVNGSSEKNDKSIQRTGNPENPFYESDVTDLYSRHNDANDSYYKCKSDSEALPTRNHDNTKVLPWKDQNGSLSNGEKTNKQGKTNISSLTNPFRSNSAIMRDAEVDDETGSSLNKSKMADNTKLVLRIEMRENDIRSVTSNETNEHSIDVSPLKVEIERVPINGVASKEGNGDKSDNMSIHSPLSSIEDILNSFERPNGKPPTPNDRTTLKIDLSNALNKTKDKSGDDLLTKKKDSFDLKSMPLVAKALERPTKLELMAELLPRKHIEMEASLVVEEALRRVNSCLNASPRESSLRRSSSDTSGNVTVMPPNICDSCHNEITILENGIAACLCNSTYNDTRPISYRLLAESTILTDSDDDDSNDYSDQDASQSDARKKITPVVDNTQLSMYSRRQPDEFVDEDDMDDEELVRLVDQTNEDDLSGSITEDAIYIEEKVLVDPTEPRGPAVGESEDSMSVSDRGTPDRMYKLVLAGDAAVGKSSFIIRLCRNKFYSALNSTLGVDFQMKTLNVDGSKVALQLWDTAGQERFRSIAKSYFRRVDGVILLYDVTCENSFMDVRDWLDSIESSNSKEVPVIICGNKTDLREEAAKNGMPVVTRQQGMKLAQDVNALFIETSAKDGTNIHKACVELTRKLQKIDDDQMNEVTVNLDEKQKPKSRCCR